MSHWKIKQYREVGKKHLPLLEQAGLINEYRDIIEILRENPYQKVRNNEVLQSRQKKIRSMRINNQHRVIFTVNKSTKEVTIWAAWSHYEQGKPFR
ncbi:MAG: Txe/YoeB family addiction module toxin [Alkalibacterium sp.]|nr:Txe/YoeB family addiction module toxin [Alkalibacterium sp.]